MKRPSQRLHCIRASYLLVDCAAGGGFVALWSTLSFLGLLVFRTLLLVQPSEASARLLCLSLVLHKPFAIVPYQRLHYCLTVDYCFVSLESRSNREGARAMRRGRNAQRITPSGQTSSLNPVEQNLELGKRSRPGAAAEAAFSFSLSSCAARHKSRDKSLVEGSKAYAYQIPVIENVTIDRDELRMNA